MDSSRSTWIEYRLAKRAKEGDRTALDELATRLRGPMFAVAYRVCGHYEDAQDAVASALYRVCRHIGRLHDPARARAYILQTAHREACRIRQNRSLHRALNENESLSPSLPFLRWDMERILQSLPADQARAIALFYFEGWTIGQIAEEVGRPEGTIKYWLHRGRAHLHTTLEGYIPMIDSNNMTPAGSTAAILHTELAPNTIQQMIDALRSAGWGNVLVLDKPGEFLKSEAGSEPDKSQMALRRLLADCRFVILDEWVGGHSAFALSALIRASEMGKQMLLMFLADGTRSEDEASAAAMAAYIAGFDLLLMKPFTADDMQGFARRAIEHLNK